MRRRVVGSLLVVVVGLIPLFIGGPVFGLFMVVLGVAGYREYLELVVRVTRLKPEPISEQDTRWLPL